MHKSEGQYVKKQWKTPVIEELSVPSTTEGGLLDSDREAGIFYAPS